MDRRPWEELPALFAMIDELREQGLSEEEISDYLQALDNELWAEADLDMELAGVPVEVRTEFWSAMNTFGDFDPEDAIDAEDEV